MIFGMGLFMFVLALAMSLLSHPKKAGVTVAVAGLFGLVLMLVSVCMLVARVMP